MRWVRSVAIGVVCVGVLSGGTRERADHEVVVFEKPDCAPCRVFRRDIVKPYFQSNRGTVLPMQVVDYHRLGTAGRALNSPITTLPTAVILSNGREIGRVTGYPGTDNFMQLMDVVIEELSLS